MVRVSPSSEFLAGDLNCIIEDLESPPAECTRTEVKTEVRGSNIFQTFRNVSIHDEINDVYVSTRPKRFPWINCWKTFSEYQKYQKSHFDIYQCKAFLEI